MHLSGGRAVAEHEDGIIYLAIGLLLGASLAVTAYARVLGKKVEKSSPVPAQGPTDPNAATPADTATAMKQEKLAQWAIPALTGGMLVLNALRPAPHPTHFSVDEARALIDELRPRRAFLVHMTHDLDHEATNVTFPDNIRLAYDGLTIEVAEEESYVL